MRTRKAFAELLRKTRKSAGLSQDRLAELADFDRTYISLIERCQRNVTLDAMSRLAEAMDRELNFQMDERRKK